jgi:Domain of unknown function (DUF6391)
LELGNLLLGRRIRQNHALEHATVSILASRAPGLAVSARANPRGFTIFADLDLESVRRASAEALARMRAGERELAIHPNCGTNLAVGTSVMLLGWLLALMTLRPRVRLASAAIGSLAGFASARPLGSVVQRHITTLPDVHDVRIAAIRRRHVFGRRFVEVLTATETAR